MKKYYIVSLLLIFSLFSAPQLISAEEAPVKVVATMSFLGDWSQQLLGDGAEITTLIGENQDPHQFELTASQLTALSESDVIIAFGMVEFDEWLTDFIEDDAEMEAKIFFSTNGNDYSQFDDLLGFNNPHLWLGPDIAKELVTNLKNHFEDIGLIDSTVLETNYNAYIGELDEILDRIDELEDTLNGTKVVVDHPAYFYLLNLLGVERVGAIEEKEGVESSPSHIQEIQEAMEAEDVKLIIASRTHSSDDVEELAYNTNSSIAYMVALPGELTPTYIDVLNYNLDAIENPDQPSINMGLPVNSYYVIFSFFVMIPVIRKFRR